MPKDPDGNPDGESKGIPDRLKAWLDGAKSKGNSLLKRRPWQRLTASFKDRVSGKTPTRFEFDLKKIELKKISEKSNWIRWGIIVLAVFLLAETTDRLIGLFVRPTYTAPPRRVAPISPQRMTPTAAVEYDSVMRRNMFNVEGKVPPPFDQGLLDCLSQAKPTTQRVQLLGTIVMNDEALSVALLQEEGNATKIAVKKDEAFFDGKFVAKKVDRKKFCFQVRSSGEFEFAEIPEEGGTLGVGAALSGTDGITPINEKTFAVKKTFLEDKLHNLPDVLQTARAVPYLEPGTGKFMGFLVQSVDPGSPFAQLGIHQGDILTNVNDIVLDNAGKGLEAFQRLRNSPDVVLGIIRGGEKTNLTFNVK